MNKVCTLLCYVLLSYQMFLPISLRDSLPTFWQSWVNQSHESTRTLTHLPLVPPVCVSELGSNDSGNGLSPFRCQSITWTNADLLSIDPLGTYFREIWIKIQKRFIHENAFQNAVCEMAAILPRERWVNMRIWSQQNKAQQNSVHIIWETLYIKLC